MKTIEINTAQNVRIQYELATLSNRVVAYLIDLACISGASLICFILGNTIFGSIESLKLFLYFSLGSIFLFYTLASEIYFNGQSIGKKSVGLKIIKINGEAPSNQDFFMRWIFRLIDIYMSVGSIASLLINANQRSQRLGDILSGSVVIRENSERSFSLNDILKISTKDTYEPQYPQIQKFSEQDMLFIKRVLELDRKHNNPNYKKAITQLSEQVANRLDIAPIPANRTKFLRTLINDYIVLTR